MRWPRLVPALLLSACAASHGIGPDGGLELDGPGRGPCTTARGAEICDTPECPDDRCLCTVGFDRPDGASGFCAISNVIGSMTACSLESDCGGAGLCPQYVGERPVFDVAGPCVSEAVCAEIREAGYPTVCRYGDGSLFDTGVRRVEDCPPGFAGVVCGSGCAPCDGAAQCYGPSEHSGLGVCHPVGSWLGEGRCARDPPTRDPTRLRCQSPTEACLFLRAPRDEHWDRDTWGFCKATETCTELAAARPDRFECVPTIASP